MDPCPWLSWLKLHIGEPEVTGSQPTDFVKECFSHTTYGDLDGSTPPSCAATLCAALEETGYRSTKSAAAVSFAKYGDPCELKEGAIVVLQWASGDHHVTVCEDTGGDSDLFTALNGNQGHAIQSARYGRKWIIAVRWPVKN